VIGIAPRGFFGIEVGEKFDLALPICASPCVLPMTSIAGRRGECELDVLNGRAAKSCS